MEAVTHRHCSSEGQSPHMSLSVSNRDKCMSLLVAFVP